MKTGLLTTLSVNRHEAVRLLHAAAGPVPAAALEMRHLLHGVKLMAQAGGQDVEPPTKLLVCPWGLTQTLDGPLLCDKGTMEILPERQRKARADRVPIDLDHEASFGKNRGVPRNIAGYGTPKVVEGEGIWLMDIRWTPMGRQYWANYEDLSPAILQQKDTGRVTFIDSVALTPRGMIEGLSLFSAEADSLPNPAITLPNEPVMKIEKLKAYLDRKGIAYQATATAEELMSLMEAALDKDGAEPGEGKMTADYDAKFKRLEDELANLKSADASRNQANEDARKAEIIRQASAEGKVLPPEEVIKNMSAADLQATAAAAPAGQVKTKAGSGLNPNDKSAGEKTAVLSAEDKEVARLMGVSEEQALKFAALGEAPPHPLQPTPA